jgi:outer membrane immunogenic protein
MKRALSMTLGVLSLAAGSSTVNAADLGVTAPPAPLVAPAFSWTGFFIGPNIGVGVGTTHISSALTGADFSVSRAEFIGGGQLGYNYQISPNIVIGLEGFFDGAGSDQHTVGPLLVGTTPFVVGAKTDWIATAAGRIGVTGPRVPVLFYAKGGGGWVETQGSVTDLATGLSVSRTKTLSGWLGGIGVEWAFSPNWTAFIEWQYIGLDDFAAAQFGANTFNTHNNSAQTLTVGVNYLFNWGAPAAVVPARY